jgi:Platelet-activating factor acetylhydrolase, isoform II
MKRGLVAILLVGYLAIPRVGSAQSSSAVGTPKLSTPSGHSPRLSMPSGPFGIGRSSYSWTDSSRPDRYSSDLKARRQLMVYVWYPTSEKRADARGAYIPGATELDARPTLQRRMVNEFGVNWPSIVSGKIFSHAVEGAPAAKNPSQYPVVIFSHGSGGTGFQYTSLIENLVSHGYVIAAIEHTESALVVLFPDGRAVPYHEDTLPVGLAPEERIQRRMASISATINEGAADISFVLDRLIELNTAGHEKDFPLAARLDMNAVAAMGHSAGAEFAARACQLDTRIKACVDLDGGMVPVAALPEYPDGAVMKQPLLFLEADHPASQMGGTPAQLKEYIEKREQQLERCPAGSYAVVLKSPGIAHPSFSDMPLLFAGEQGYPETKIVLHNHELIETFVRAFLDKNLKHRETPLFGRSNTSISEATVQPYGR